jgi:site-specific DNA recombinase
MDTAQLNGHKQAAIYVRVSSEQQAEGSSPETQERECQDLAAQCGLRVVEVYKDITAYRVRGKLIEPSGTRADRPGLLAMLRDAATGRFVVIIAWREDRLYRALRVMLNVLEVIKEHDIEIKLVKEQFDAKLAPLKAWVASMELDAIKERTTTGTKRVTRRQTLAGQDRYGYRHDFALSSSRKSGNCACDHGRYIAGTSIDEISS